MEEIKVGEYISRKEYLKKYDSNVGYALHVQNSIKKDDYARLNTGEIVKVIGIKENNVNKKAIYYGIYDYDDWFDSGAVENFSNNIMNLIKKGDYVNGYKVERVKEVPNEKIGKVIELDDENVGCYDYYPLTIYKEDIKSIVTKEQFESIEYKVEGK